jgi:hypothetical protein
MRKKNSAIRSRQVDSGNTLVVHIRDAESNKSVPNVHVAVANQPCRAKHKALADETGTAKFSNLESGRLFVEMGSKYAIDHLQFRGKSHQEASLVLHQKDVLEITIYIRPAETAAHSLDKVVERELFERLNPAALETGFEEVMADAELLRKRVKSCETSMVFRQHSDKVQLAIQIQERLGMPKFIEEHPEAPAIWQRCLEVAESLQPMIVSRHYWGKELRYDINKIESCINAMKVQRSQANLSVLKPEKLSARMSSLKDMLSSTKEKLAIIEEHNAKIDSPERLDLILEQVGPKPEKSCNP